MSAFWLEFEQNGTQQKYPFDQPSVTVGRDATSDFVLDHPTVSRRHAVINRGTGGFRLSVLSQGGLTAVDGTKVVGDVDLFDGSLIHFGQFSFTFRSKNAPRKPATGAFASGLQPPSAVLGGLGFGGTPPGSGLQSAAGFAGMPTSGTQPAGGAQPAGFGAKPAKPSSGFGSGGLGGGSAGFGSGGLNNLSKPAPEKPKAADGIVSWDEIANSAEAMGREGDAVERDFATDFQRMQNASEKAAKQSGGNNPLVIVGGGALIIAFLVYIFMPQTGPKAVIGEELPVGEQVPVKWAPNEIDCVGSAECMQKAELNYKVGLQNLEKVNVDIANRFDGYNRLLKTEAYLKKAGKDGIPPEFDKLVANRDEARKELDATFQQARVTYHSFSQRKMYSEMVGVINEVLAVFPHKGAREYQWAIKKERALKDAGNYPQTF